MMRARRLQICGLCLIGVSLSAAAQNLRAIDAAASFPEGPLWIAGRLYYVEYGANRVREWDGKRIRTLWQGRRCGPSGLIEFGEQHLLITCYDSNSLSEIDTAGRLVSIYTRDSSGQSFVGPNDFASDGHGGVYFSASGSNEGAALVDGAVLHLSPSGAIEELAAGVHSANGLTRSKDGKSLLVAETADNLILEFPIREDGSLGERQIWVSLADMAPNGGPDGLKLGPDDHYYIAHNGSGSVLVLDESRHLLRKISVPTTYVTNLTFGDASLGEIFITGVHDMRKPPYLGEVYRYSP